MKGRPIVVPLSGVKRVYVETVGNETSNQSMREALIDKLRASNRIIMVSNRDEADALMEVSVLKGKESEQDTIGVVVQLINARGNTIWPNAYSSAKYQGSAYDVSARIVNDLLAAIQKSH
jgi:hypothetical protein